MGTRSIIIGDIHGCIDELRDMMKKLKIEKGDNIVFLGDLVDRGPGSLDVLRLVIDIQRKFGAHVLMGNHEEKHYRYRKYLSGIGPKIKMTREQQSVNSTIPSDLIEWMSHLPKYVSLGNGWVAVHGGLEPKPFEEQGPNLNQTRFINSDGTLSDKFGLESGSRFWTDLWSGPESVVYGHYIHNLIEPRVMDKGSFKCVGIDTGVCFGGNLTAMVSYDGMKTFDFVQVKAKKPYKSKLF
jgi:bis(5'-nucleosyl)-tetraphosphatase (symmetrical)